MQRVNIYNDLLHLTGEWMNADMLNRGTEDPPSLSLSIFFLFLGGGGGRTSPPLPSGSATDIDEITNQLLYTQNRKSKSIENMA